jgi:hypothetical protein
MNGFSYQFVKDQNKFFFQKVKAQSVKTYDPLLASKVPTFNHQSLCQITFKIFLAAFPKHLWPSYVKLSPLVPDSVIFNVLVYGNLQTHSL